MVQFNKGSESITQAEHISPDKTGDNIEAKKVAQYGYDASTGQWRRLSVDSSGKLQIDATIEAGDIEIGAVEIKDGASDNRQTVDGDGAARVRLSSIVSAIGVNSDTAISASNWTTNTWTGDGEQNDYQYAAVSLKTDETGTLFFDFSNDGTNWDSFPTAGFPVISGTHEIHTAFKGGRYFRPRFVGTGGRTYFRLYTYYTNSEARLNSPLNLSLTADADAVTVKAPYKMEYNTSPSTVADGDYDLASITKHREVRTRDQRSQDLANCNTVGDYTVLGNDTTGLASSSNHVFGTGAITFNKVNGAANTVFAGVSTTITTLDISEIFEDGAFVGAGVYLPSLTNVVAVFVRIGTNSSNYNEWEWESADLVANNWMALRAATSQPSAYAGTGWNTNAISYVAFGVEFNSESNTLSGIVFDNIHLVKGRVTDTTLDASISTSVTSPNINVARVGGNQTSTNTGNADTGTQRVVLATNQPTVPVSGTFYPVTQPVSAASLPLPSGAATEATLTDILAALGGGAYATNIDTTSTADTIYIGQAVPGTATSAASWQVKKLNTSSGVVTTWADGDASYNNIWDNRVSLSYS